MYEFIIRGKAEITEEPILRRRHNGKKKYWIIGVVLLVAVIAAVAVIRIRSLKSEMKYDPVTKGEAYENYNKDKAEALVKEYFEAMSEKDMDRLDNIFYQKDILKCFAVSNDMTEEKVLESLKEQVDKLELTYKEESISDYSAYPEIYVDDMNDSIYKAIGKENVIKYMYSISIKYVQHTTIGWEEKRDSIKVYVIDDGYYIWPSTGEEK